MNFKPNSTLNNRLVRRDLHSFIYFKFVLYLVHVGLPTQIKKERNP